MTHMQSIMKTMTFKSAIAGLMFTAIAAGAQTNSFTFSSGQSVPDGNTSGLAVSTNLSGMSGNISSVTVSLNISGGYNGDLYAYLAGPNGGFSVLLNRVGVSNSASAFGYSDAGFNITLSDSAANSVQYYQSYSPTFSGGQLTGLWQPEGVNIDPQSSPTTFFNSPQTAMLSSFGGTDPNGAWTLYIADLSAGGQSTLLNWGLDIVTVPEPASYALIVTAAGALLGWRIRLRNR